MKTGELNIVDSSSHGLSWLNFYSYFYQGIKDYQTEADRRVNQLIVSTLARQLPKVKIIGQEDGFEGNNYDNFCDERAESVLTLECPKDLLDVVEDQV